MARRGFYPRDPCGPRRREGSQGADGYLRFYPRDPCGPRRPTSSSSWLCASVSIRATRAGRDRQRTPVPGSPPGCFYPRDPCGPRLAWRTTACCRHRFYPRDPCGPRLAGQVVLDVADRVSIRATRAGRDGDNADAAAFQCSFYPRDPCGPRHLSASSVRPCRGFYPRDPCGPRRSSCCSCSDCHCRFYPRDPCGPRHHRPLVPRRHPGRFYPRDPCGPRPGGLSGQPAARLVSIRATRAGRDRLPGFRQCLPRSFYPRDPCGPRHLPVYRAFGADGVSIRATRAGRDRPWLCCGAGSPASFYPRDPCGPRRLGRTCPRQWLASFYPRDPCGPRPSLELEQSEEREFLSARPVRAATLRLCHTP